MEFNIKSIDIVSIINKYKKCPSCGNSYSKIGLQCAFTDDILTLSCTCGFFKAINENNKDITQKVLDDNSIEKLSLKLAFKLSHNNYLGSEPLKEIENILSLSEKNKILSEIE